MMIVVVVVVTSLLGACVYLGTRKKRVRAKMTGPWSLSVEFEADDGDQPKA